MPTTHVLTRPHTPGEKERANQDGCLRSHVLGQSKSGANACPNRITKNLRAMDLGVATKTQWMLSSITSAPHANGELAHGVPGPAILSWLYGNACRLSTGQIRLASAAS
jgi:hypothetical protein